MNSIHRWYNIQFKINWLTFKNIPYQFKNINNSNQTNSFNTWIKSNKNMESKLNIINQIYKDKTKKQIINKSNQYWKTRILMFKMLNIWKQIKE